MGLSLSFSTLKSSLSNAVSRLSGSVKPIAGVVVGAGLGGILTAGSDAIDKLKAKNDANLARARGNVPAQTRAGIVGLFGGVPIEAVLILGALTVAAVILLRKKK